jgi:iron-sulfur cluster repair protein YtfE (RIC family)
MTITDGTAAETTLPRAGLAPRLAAYAAIHDAMVRDAGRLARAVATAPLEAGPALNRWWDLYEANIEHHHVREDEVVFPLVAEHDPAFTSGELMADHAVLDLHMGLVRGSLQELVTGRRELALVRTDLVRQVGAFAQHLDDHLGREEHVVFPVVTDRVDEDDWADAEKAINDGTSMGELAFTLPWILDDADPALIAHAEIPFLLRALDGLLWERRYRRVAAPLLAAR